MSDDFSECIFTSDDPEIEVFITHDRDRLVFGGKVEQDYRFLTYRFPDKGGDVERKGDASGHFPFFKGVGGFSSLNLKLNTTIPVHSFPPPPPHVVSIGSGT